ncbi:MAG TPA: prephenate dehydrogenase/arogenate dehydrogenase family protein [Paludibacter sp.]|nr:prephenate dehydrogenase/arogenate dehydrogenase family protein [Paludibacter sp.]HOS46403.1 prephenate dehydrogenase/arogenate dehydrogenase family protein [Paludibacter sp.]HPM10426.1 prephenate dehydrogenase/arogenate dehydrogenase family protein [Paludibacter sp.]
MKICILGVGKMGTWLADALCFQHEVAVFDSNKERLRYVFNTQRLTDYEEIRTFAPELLINCVTLKYTIQTFKDVLPYLPENCIISDIASVKTGFYEFYKSTGRRFVSTHPMFGPTFANLRNLSEHHAIIISESDHLGKAFFKDFYGTLKLNLHQYTFEGHDETIAYSLSIPFSSTLVFAACMKKQDAPGTTFKKHMDIAKGLFSEDDHLLTEILFNPYTVGQVEKIRKELKDLMTLINSRDAQGMIDFINRVRKNVE